MSRVAVIGIIGNSVFLPIDHFHQGGETLQARSISFEAGGKGFNAAVAAKRYGAEVSFLAAIGKEDGAEMVTAVRNEGIEGMLIPKEGRTSFAAILTDQSGCNHVTVYRGAPLEPKDVEQFEAQIAAADLLLLSNEVPEAVNLKAVRIAKSHRVPVILNPAPARPLDPALAEEITLFTPNEHEVQEVEGRQNVVVTLGKEGCHIRSLNRTLPAIDAGAVVDTTGAGDTFNGVLAAKLAEGAPLCEAVETANLAASVKVTRRGVLSAIPTKEEIIKEKNK